MVLVSLRRLPSVCDAPWPHSFTCGSCSAVQRFPALLGGKGTWLLSCGTEIRQKTFLGSVRQQNLHFEAKLASCFLRKTVIYMSIKTIHIWNLEIVPCRPTLLQYSSFLLFTWKSFDSLWRAIFNPVVGTHEAQMLQEPRSSGDQGIPEADSITTEIRGTWDLLLSCPQRGMAVPWAMAGKQMVTDRSPNPGHVHSERWCIPAQGQKSWSGCFTKAWKSLLPDKWGSFRIPNRYNTLMWGYNVVWFPDTIAIWQ